MPSEATSPMGSNPDDLCGEMIIVWKCEERHGQATVISIILVYWYAILSQVLTSFEFSSVAKTRGIEINNAAYLP